MIKPGFIVGAKPFVIDELFAEFSQTDGNASTIMDELFAELSWVDGGSVVDELFAEFAREDLWTPAQISTSIWLDAADASTITSSSNLVSQWDDKSGNNNHLAQATASLQPLYNVNQVEFAVNENLFKNSVANMLNSSGTTSLFIVHDIIDPTTSSGNFTTILRNSSTEADPTKRRPFMIYGKVGDTLGISNSSSSSPNITTASTKTGRSVISYTQSPTQATVFLDGTQQAQINNTPNTSTTSELFTLVNAADTNNTMVFSEVILVNDLVTLEVRQKIEGYLAWKWDLTASLPADHPYKTKAP